MVEILSKIKIDIFDEITQYGYDDVQQLLNKFSKAMGVPIKVKRPLNFDDTKAFINGVPNALYLAKMYDIDNNIQGTVLFAKPKASEPNDDPDRYAPITLYPPRTLADKPAVESLDNKMFFLGDGDDEVQTISVTPLKGSERVAVAKQLRQKYRVRSRSNNRFVVFFSQSQSFYTVDAFLGLGHLGGRGVTTLFDRQDVYQVRKLVMRRRDANGKMQEVVRYCMEPVLCETFGCTRDPRPLRDLVSEYLNRTGRNDEKLSAQLSRYQKRIEYANGWRGFRFLLWGFWRGRDLSGLYSSKGMMTWLRLDI